MTSIHMIIQSLKQPKAELNPSWYLASSDDYELLLDAIQDTEDANVRIQLARLAMSWLNQSVLKTPLIVGCAHILATDVWSQIRKEAAVQVAKRLPQLTLANIEAVLHDLLQICKDPKEDWKSIEGAFGMVAGILKQIKKQTPFGYQLGSHSMQFLPSVFLTELKPAVYQAMQHSQLSVRENATAAIIEYVALSDAFTQVTTFQEVISKLNLYSPHEVLPAAHAEGLLDVAAQLVPHIPLTFLVKHWQVVFPTCEKYVMHVASTVRQKSAALISALATLSTTHVEAITFLISILDSLALPCTQHPDVNQREFFWQRMEGRLMSIDMIVQVLGRNELAWLSPILTQANKRPRNYHSYHQSVEELTHYEHVFANDMAPLSTWVTESAIQPRHSILANITTPLDRVWHAYLSHVHTCFQSTQYELKRMAVQTLPGLIRLSLYLNKPEELLPSWLQSEPNVNPIFLCSALKSLVLHSVYLKESSKGHPDIIPKVLGIMQIARAIESRLLGELLRVECLDPLEKSHGLSYIETGILMLIACSDNQSGDLKNLQVLRKNVFDILWSFHTQQASVDRTMSSLLVRYLPGLGRLALDESEASKIISISLSWLVAEDNLRWIVVDSKDARCLLLDTLSLLIQNSMHARSLWSMQTLISHFGPLMRKPEIPLRQYAKMLFVLSSACKTNSTESILSLLHLLLDKDIVKEKISQKKATLWDEWDEDAQETTPHEMKEKCLKEFWREFDALSATQQRISDLIVGSCTPEEQLRLQQLQC